MKMSDLAKLLGDAYQNLDSFPLDKQKEILDLVERISETRDKENFSNLITIFNEIRVKNGTI